LDLKALLQNCESDLDAMLSCLRQAVEIESPSNSKPDVDRMANFFAGEFTRARGKVKLLSHRTAGSALVAEFWGGKSNKPLLLLGHTDTVWDVGTLKRMPFLIKEGLAYGPGIFDMKAGIVCALWAIRALQALKMEPSRPVRCFLNSDEEVSTLAFRPQLEKEATRSKAVLVLEPALGTALKTARKGVGEFRVTVHGRAAHAGVSPGSGVNAITELARQILRIQTLTRPRRGITVNVGVIEGGTRGNVVPERASALIDVRIPRLVDREWIERQFHSLEPFHLEAKLEITGGVNRPPMERHMAAELFRHAVRVGHELGLGLLKEGSTGGGSDGNFTAALGIPTLDGLGAVGDGAHALNEHVVISELPRRAALLAGLLATL